MTFSILAYDEKTKAYGAAAATGSLCVGGWVLRGEKESGLSASQGTSPSTMWGGQVLALMKAGQSAENAIAQVTGSDPGRGHRQLSALAPGGDVAAFTGSESVAFAGSVSGRNVVVAGNMLDSDAVLPAILAGFAGPSGALATRLLAALNAGQAAGGDTRGLQSAALLVIARNAAPLDLRIDYSTDPLADLAALYRRSQTDPYRAWAASVPTPDDPFQDGSGAKDRSAGELRQTLRGLGSEL